MQNDTKLSFLLKAIDLYDAALIEEFAALKVFRSTVELRVTNETGARLLILAHQATARAFDCVDHASDAHYLALTTETP